MTLTAAQINALKHLSGDTSVPWPKNRWQVEQLTRALIGRGLINPDGWTLTEAGRETLAEITG
jgi:hypothetical protein